MGFLPTKIGHVGLDRRVKITKKKIGLMWDGMNFFIYKTKMGLVFKFGKKNPPPLDFFAPHFSFFGHLLPTVSYCNKLCTDKFMGTMLLVS